MSIVASGSAHPTLTVKPGQLRWVATLAVSICVAVWWLWPEFRVEVANTPTWYKGKPWSGNPDAIPYEIDIDLPRRVWAGSPFRVGASLEVSLSEGPAPNAWARAETKLPEYVAQLRMSGPSVSPMIGVAQDGGKVVSWSVTVEDAGTYFGRLWFIDPERSDRYYSRDIYLKVE